MELKTEDLPMACRGCGLCKSSKQMDKDHSLGWSSRIIAILTGQPDSKDWDEVNAAAANAMVEVQQRCIFTQSGVTHRFGFWSTFYWLPHSILDPRWPPLAYGLCNIHDFGSFDPKAGGHLILFDIKIAIEFPFGSTIQIPSTVLQHGDAAFLHTIFCWWSHKMDLCVQNPRLKQKLDEENDLEGNRRLLFKRKAMDGQLLDA
ncbi:hypothetical protein EDD22DRAFT_845764 [Suillus occidentalis]|nr:hypothetical protein EDD22DRAFT_845764 [Suillus occidentalis]